jgi:hypothetical protein
VEFGLSYGISTTYLAAAVADDVSMSSMADYLAYVRDPANGYVSVAFPVEDGMEISCRADR